MNEKECLDHMEEEYRKGVNSVITFLRDEKFLCDPPDGCEECEKIERLLNRKYVKDKEGVSI